MRLFSFALMALLPLLGGNLSGKRAPSFALPDSNLHYHDILDYRGKPLVLEFMKTDCPHCKNTSLRLEELKAQFGDKVNILHIVMPPDTTGSVGAFVAALKVTSPFLFDSGQVLASYLVLKPTMGKMTVDVPVLVIIDPQGIIREDYQGEVTSTLKVGDLAAAVKKAMIPAPAKK